MKEIHSHIPGHSESIENFHTLHPKHDLFRQVLLSEVDDEDIHVMDLNPLPPQTYQSYHSGETVCNSAQRCCHDGFWGYTTGIGMEG